MDNWYSRKWNPLSDPTLPLREPDRGPWLVESDLFGPTAGDREDQINEAFSVMAIASAFRPASFIVPTADPASLATYLRWDGHDREAAARRKSCGCRQCCIARAMTRILQEADDRPSDEGAVWGPAIWLWKNWPIPRIIPAVVLRTQADADRLVPDLLRVPCGPLGRAVVIQPTEFIDLTMLRHDPHDRDCWMNALVGSRGWSHGWFDMGDKRLRWVIVPETDGAKPDHVRDLRNQCRAARVPLWSAVPIGRETVREWPEGMRSKGQEDR